MTTTESALKEWRYGQTQAERMVGALLHLEEFESVDPQHPLGGPDGIKDLLCRKHEVSWVAAAYFPPTSASFQAIKDKFKDDLRGVKKNNARGFAFFVNQPMTAGQRKKLVDEAGDVIVEIFHLERIKGILDAPKGCGVRLEYLRIPMTEEEQWAFWETKNRDVVRHLSGYEARREAQFRVIDEKLDHVLRRTQAIGVELAEHPSHLQPNPSGDFDMPTASLSLSTICWIHRIVTEDEALPEDVQGRFRTVNVWIGTVGANSDSDKFIPARPEEIVERTRVLLDNWRKQHAQLVSGERAVVVAALASFHHGFLKIHPFLDANGRVSLLLLDQAARELLNQRVKAEFTADRAAYYASLQAADAGNLEPLTSRLSAALG